jgi:hypothetical protein
METRAKKRRQWMKDRWNLLFTAGLMSTQHMDSPYRDLNVPGKRKSVDLKTDLRDNWLSREKFINDLEPRRDCASCLEGAYNLFIFSFPTYPPTKELLLFKTGKHKTSS